jgi:hypothetical protein
MRQSILAVIAIAAVTGCAGRTPEPVAVVQPQDRYLDCAAIEAEVVANNKTVQQLSSDEGSKVGQNVAAGVAGIFIWPLWFAMDFQGAAGKEEAALQSRQQYLGTLAIERGCATAPPRMAATPAPAVAAVPTQAAARQ